MLFATGLAASAEETGEQAEPVLPLTEVVVVGVRLPSLTSENAVVLDRTTIEHSGATRVEDLIARLPWNYAGAASGIATVPNGSPSYGTATDLFNFSGSSSSIRQSGVAAAGLRGLGAGGTLVLIDGRRAPLATQGDVASDTGTGFYDLASIPLGLVERIEVLPDSASAVYGADAVGGVINIVLKRDYNGGELAMGIRGTTRGGGFERQATLSGGFARGALRLLASITVFDRNSLRADQRAYSARQDLTALGGRDFRLSVGSPAVVNAASGSLNGLTLNGNPVNFALVKMGQDGTAPTLTDFEPVAGFTASNLRRYNSAGSKDLVGAMDQQGLHLAGDYEFSERMQAFVQFTWSDRQAVTRNEPPATLGGGFGGTDTRVPASDPRNPFGQDVLVSLVHVEAPERPQTVEVENLRVTTGLRGKIGHDWRWEAAATTAREDFASRTLELRNDLFMAALADGRFNPFGDPAIGPLNESLYADLMTDAVVDGFSRIVSADITAAGPVASLPAGEALLATGLEFDRAVRHRSSSEPVFGQEAISDTTRDTTALFAEMAVPLFGPDNAQPALQRLELRLAARYEHTRDFAETTPGFGLRWSPLEGLTLHANYAAGFRPPSLSEYERTLLSGSTTIHDPVRNETYEVTRRRGSNPHARAETSRSRQHGITFAPDFLEGFRFHVLATETDYHEKLTELSAQTLVNFESTFPDRVVRDGSGRITTVDQTTINFGRINTRSLDLRLIYTREIADAGRWTLQADAVRQLGFRTELVPGRTAVGVFDGEDTLSPPRWTGLGSLWWNRGNWNAGILATFVDGYTANSTGSFSDQNTAIPSWMIVDVRGGYRFAKGVWRGRGRGLALTVGIGNVADRDPPFANTVYGYNQSLHNPLGRTYDISLRLPF